ncbi:hypothetical protein ACS0TY_021078 [Phlomoides rotata]
MRSTTHGVDPALLGFTASFSAVRVLKLPVKHLPVVKFSGKRRTVSCSTSPPSLGRRALMYMATTSLLVPHSSWASATDEISLLQEEIGKVLSKGKAAGLLRLVFHDAGTFDKGDKTGGMNGSIVYELDRPENTGLKKSLKILEKAKGQVDAVRPVSWADLIAVAGAEAVLTCGGPKITVKLGRIDATVPDPKGKLPEESLDANSMKQFFQKKGFSAQELVALSGAHTLGSKGFGNPTVFDNSYYKILLEKPWSSPDGMSSMVGLPSDRALVEDDECNRYVLSQYYNFVFMLIFKFRDFYHHQSST